MIRQPDDKSWKSPSHPIRRPARMIQDYMVPSPWSMGSWETVARAASLMAQHDVRQLVVLHGGILLYVITRRDMKLIAAFRDVDTAQLTLAEAMTEEPYTVGPDTSLDKVVGDMASGRCDVAVIVKDHKVMGIFTNTEVCRVLSVSLGTEPAAR
jgi:acetoin utilization protein AcuB